ncbi:hypothetical protein [Bythopirellula polymerisocia]|uniref:PEP-CTERM protein-sorting domain-containing protein n=1 Tax=Bythopirellula polymerisocia TaxID=2528003 RepID=A0A5C6CLX5_9BACT|nr:hypothetical protein [Bythopirellula polymerisocia]TWU24557.1 hypothetical protein Pla144_34410 [Bythopirellula polymerisocia]
MNSTRRTTFLLSVSAFVIASLLTASLQATVIVDDDWSDGDLAKTGALDTNWWTSSSSSGIEVSVGSMGLVTGTSGRGIHTVFPAQTLANVGDKILATYTFTTPATVGRPSSAPFRVGLFDSLGRAGLNADVSASSGSPNELYGWTGAVPPTAGLPGYMLDMDLGDGTTEDLNFREHDTANATGRLLATTTGFNSVPNSGPDGAYQFLPDTTYTGSFQVKRISATEMELTGTLDPGIGGIATHTVTDAFDSNTIDMLGFHVNSNIFGSSNVAGEADNGIDFSNITVEFCAVPEPASVALLIGALIALPGLGRRL